MRAEAGDRAGEQRLQLLAPRDLARERSRDALVGRALASAAASRARDRRETPSETATARARPRAPPSARRRTPARRWCSRNRRARSCPARSACRRPARRRTTTPRPGRRRRPPARRPRCHQDPTRRHATRRRRRGRSAAASSRAGSPPSPAADAGRSRGSGESACMTIAFELRVDVRHERRRRRRRSCVAGALGERVLSDEQLVQDQAERVDVGALRERRARPFAARAPCRRACRSACANRSSVRRDRDPEIGDPDQAVVVDQHVGRLEIAVQHALRVRRRQTGAELTGDVDDLLGRQPADAPQQRREVLAVAPAPSSRRCTPSASPTSKTRQTAGCVICRASRTSLRMRSRPSGAAE